MLCSQQEQPGGQTFDINCYGKQVNEAAKTACLNKLNTVSCDEFNGPTYNDDCELVCTAGGGGGSGGTTGTGGTGGMSGGGCGSTQPCGGDILGTWSFTDVCVKTPPAGDSTCPGDTISDFMITEAGTLSFASGGAYTASINATQSYTEMTPSSCISPATCADLAAAYQSLGASATCSGTTVCTCTIALAVNGTAAGTYTTSGSTLTIMASTGSQPDSMGYCVQGNQVHFLHFNSAGQVTTDETAQRQ
jgi:hypothetical protein